MVYKVYWTQESLYNLEDIIDYLKTNWTNKELKGFKEKLNSLIELITHKPRMFPKSHYRQDLYKAVLSKQTSIYYRITDSEIHLVFLFDNRMNPEKL